MSRYRGPRLKVCRTLGTILPGLTSASVLNRQYPPGEHGAGRKGKPSDFKIRLIEKQKARFHFGIQEKQFRRYVTRASRMKGATGRNLLILLESRLDNLIWRLGLARTIVSARQMVVHGHIFVDGRRVDRPSFHVAPGQVITASERAKGKPFFQSAIEESATRTRPGWLEWDPGKATGKLLGPPDRADLPIDLNENAIIEFYSQKL
ncbi:MAG TPA: 30S ribosomal protein S4 [Myxococcota bacterium]|nr:30S ribosomal protein S4 [Myxococcota bacterium]